MTGVKMSVEQRSAIKFCVLNGISRGKTIEMLQQAYGDSSVKKTAVYKWYNRFKEGRQGTGDDERSGRPVTKTSSYVADVKDLLDKDRRLTIREITES
jgi:transposase